MEEVKCKGYSRIPTKKLMLSVRRSPCGEGNFLITNTQSKKVQTLMTDGKWKFIKEYLDSIAL